MTDSVPVESAIPWMGVWWRAQANTPPTIVVRCQCGKKVGEVKRSETGHPHGGPVVLLMAIEDIGETTVDVGEFGAENLEELAAELDALEKDTLRRLPDGRRVMKRQRLAYAVGPVDGTPLMCPTHGYLTDYSATLAEMASDTPVGSKRKYVVAH